MHSRRELAEAFQRLGIRPGDTVMLHASVRAVGEVAGGPDQIHLALKDALTTAGTLLMYVGCPDHYDEVGRGFHSPERSARSSTRCPPSIPSRRERRGTTARWSSSCARIPGHASTRT